VIRWGKAGAGILFICGNEILLLLRSTRVTEPLSWGIPGGSIAGEDYFASHTVVAAEKFPIEMAWEGAKKEVFEELGSMPICEPFDHVLYQEGGFVYTTFLVRISEQQKKAWCINLNWENIQWEWFPITNLPLNLHFGVKYVIDQRPALFAGYKQEKAPLVEIPSKLFHGTSLENLLAIVEYGGLSPGRGPSPHRTITRNALFFSDDPQAALLYADQSYPVILEINTEGMRIEPDWDDAGSLIEIDLHAITEELDSLEEIGLGHPLSEEQTEQIQELFDWGAERAEPWSLSIIEQNGFNYLVAEPHVRLSVDNKLIQLDPELYDYENFGFDEGNVFYIARQYLSYRELYFSNIIGIWISASTIQKLSIPTSLIGKQMSLKNYSVIEGLEDLDIDSLVYDDPRLDNINFREETFYQVDILRLREFLSGGQTFFWRK
jgi:8-oxo-dGTP pyrophosphatase MutT (NUDIX family)